MPRTKKIGSSGKFGPRYGTKIRKLALAVDKKLQQRYKCPSCGAVKVKRIGTSIWQCGRCGVKFAGAAYSLSALASLAEMKAPGGVEES
ncbi:MAG: 50S ribosomal protein L37Ae [Hadesarchaea archaeon]|nr:50S ribosomal protein L37Ae [Hadesarchaea archaeon]